MKRQILTSKHFYAYENIHILLQQIGSVVGVDQLTDTQCWQEAEGERGGANKPTYVNKLEK